MLRKIKTWWQTWRLRQEMKTWNQVIAVSRPFRSSDEGAWTEAVDWYGWEKQWGDDTNAHSCERLVKKTLNNLATDLENKNKEVQERVKIDTPVEFIEHVMLKKKRG